MKLRHLSASDLDRSMCRTALTAMVALAFGALSTGFASTADAETGPPHDAEPFEAEPPAWFALAEASAVPDDAIAVVLHRRNVFSFDAKGRLAQRRHTVYQIRDQSAAEMPFFSTVGRSWAPWHQERPEIRARVMAPDAATRELEPTTLVESPTADTTPDLFDDRLVLEGPLPGLRPGVIVELETVVRDREPYFIAGTSGRHFLLGASPLVREEVLIEAPLSLPLRFDLFGLEEGDAEVTETELDGFRRVKIVRDDVAPFERVDPGLPFDVAAYPFVEFSTAESWAAVASSYGGTVAQQLAGADVSELLGSVDRKGDRRQRIDAVLAALQARVRYVGLELGSASLVPRSPGETLQREFGDCKDKSTLLVAALRASGLEAHVALLRSGGSTDVSAELPGIGLFNHAIVYLPASGESEALWIDPTASNARAGQLPLAVQGRLALVTGTGTGHEALIQIPASHSEANRVIEEREIVLAEYGSGLVKETSAYFGAFELQRRSFESTSDEDRRSSYERYVKSYYAAEELGSFEETAARDLDELYTLSLEALEAGAIVTDLDVAFADVSIQGIFSDMPAELMSVPEESEDEGRTARTASYRQLIPQVKEYRIRVVPPPGFEVRELPEDRDEALGAARFTQRFEEDGDVVVATFRFDSGPRLLDADTFHATRRALAEFSEESSPGLFFDHRSSAALATGRAREAILDLRAITASGDSALDHVRLARALLTVGLGEQARESARRAVELAPESPIAHWSLGFMLSHDRIGRLRQGDFDHAGARAALERAVELGPDERLPRSELALLLDFDAEGRRHGKASDLDSALEHYRTWREKFGTDFAINEMNTLVAADRWKELLELTKELPAGLPRDTWHVAALAAEKSVDRAMREARALAADRTQRSTTVAGASHILILGRRYAESAELLRRMAATAANPAAVQHQADSLAKIVRVEDMEFPEDEPASVVKQLSLVSMDSKHASPDDIRPFLHPVLLEKSILDDEIFEDLFKSSLDTIRKMAGDVSLQTLTEMGLGFIDVTVEGRDELGYRITSSWDLQGSATEAFSFVKPFEGEGYRVAAFEQSPATLAWEILRRIENEDLEGARQWLDWARETTRDFDFGDPFLAIPFRTAWMPESNEVAPGRLRLAAHVLLASDDHFASEAIEPLETVLKSLDENPDLRRAVEMALANAYGDAERWADHEALYRRFRAEHPTSEMAYRLLELSLASQDKLDALRTLAKEQLAREGADRSEKIPALQSLASLAIQDEDFERLGELIDRIEEIDPDAVGNLWNVQAWELLFHDPIPEEALERAQAAARRRNFEDYASLHTLAAAYALFDRPLEAYQALSQAMGLEADHEPNEEDWLILGFIAESCGLGDAARDLLSRMSEPEEKTPLHSWDLARRQLRKLKQAD